MEVPERAEVSIARRQDREHGLLVSTGDFTRVHAAWLNHTRTWSGEPDGLTAVTMRQGLATLALHLANRPRDESIGFTLNFKQPALNLFLTGDAANSTVTGRAFTEGVRTSGRSRLFVQTTRPGHEPAESSIEIEGFDLPEIFEEYYRRSEQYPARKRSSVGVCPRFGS